MSSVKFLLVGDTCGRLVRLAEYLNKVNQSQGPFSFALAVGSFRPAGKDAEEEYDLASKGEVDIPLPLYVVPADYGVNDDSLEAEFSACQNIYFLRGLGVTCIHGVTVAYLSGRIDPTTLDKTDTYTSLYRDCFYQHHAIEHLVSEAEPGTHQLKCRGRGECGEAGVCLLPQTDQLREARGNVDILATSEWPRGVNNGMTHEDLVVFNDLLTPDTVTSGSSPAVSRLAKLLEPRYHIAATTGVFYQRPPYEKNSWGYSPKFISLGYIPPKPDTATAPPPSVPKSAKFLHALSLVPTLTKSLTSEPPRKTERRAQPTQTHQTDDGRGTDNSAKRQRLSADEASTLQTQGTLADAGRGQLCGETEGAARNLGTEGRPQVEAHRETKYVYVSNVPYHVDIESLLKVMRSFGTIESFHAPTDEQQNSTGKLWIEYGDLESARAAVRASSQLESGGRRLVVVFHSPKQGDKRSSGQTDATGPPNWGQRSHFNKPGPRGKVLVDVRSHADCWFCLGNPNSEKSLVLAVGKHVYLALAKGGIVENHILIIPVQHIPNMAYGCDMTKRLPPVMGPMRGDEPDPHPPVDDACSGKETTEVMNEVVALISSLRRCFNKEFDSDIVVFERFFAMRSTLRMHTQVQIVPVPRNSNHDIQSQFVGRFRSEGLDLSPMAKEEDFGDIPGLLGQQVVIAPKAEDSSSLPISPSYFYLELSGDSTAMGREVHRYLCMPRRGQRLDLNCGREPVSRALDMPERCRWQDCVIPAEQEQKTVVHLRTTIKSYMPVT